jgi:hypothetical protein
VTEFSSDDKDLLICALVNKLGGAVSLRPHELQLGNIRAQCVRLNTGTLHLELVAPPAPTSDDTPRPSTADGDTLMHLGG